MAAAAITAPKSGGQLFLAGKPNFMETVIADDPATRAGLAACMRARGKERRERIWLRDAEVAEAVDAILFVGLLPGWYPPNYDCGACGYATCAEFLNHTRALRQESAELEFAGPVCNLRDIDLDIAVGSAAKTVAIHSVDCRCQTPVAVAARKTGLIQAGHAVALSLSITPKAIGFDRAMPDADFDTLDLPPTGTLPGGVPGMERNGGARNRQAPRHPTALLHRDVRLIWHAHPGTDPAARPAGPPGMRREASGCTAGLPRAYRLPFAKYAAQVGCQDH